MAAPKRATPAQIINHLRKAEVELANGKSMKEVDDGLWHIFFAHVLLGYLHDGLRTVEDRSGFISRHRKNLSTMSSD